MDLYLKAKKLALKLVEQIIDGTEPNVHLEGSSKCEEIVRQFSDPLQRTILLNKFCQNEKSKAIQSLHTYIQHKRHRQILHKYIQIAVVLVIIIGIATSYYTQQSVDSQTTPSISSLSPGKAQAILILSNGDEVNLNNEILLKEKNTAIVNTPSGEIIYINDSKATATEAEQYNIIKVPRYGEYSVTLSDGTRIKLNAESELRYPIAFSGEQREVYLMGEAYMEVAKNQQPFILHTYNTQIKVYGTSFDVNSYNPNDIRIVLVEGKIGIHHSETEEVILHPNQLARITEKEGVIVKKDINVNYYIAWQEGYFAFEEDRLEDIMTTLSRWYQMDVIFENSQAKEIRFTASMRKEENINKLLNQFELTRTVSFNIIENQIFIK